MRSVVRVLVILPFAGLGMLLGLVGTSVWIGIYWAWDYVNRDAERCWRENGKKGVSGT